EAGVQGKAGYMSPEAAAGSPIDERSDVFAAGIILWELLNGRRLYRGENRQAPTLEMAAQAEIPPLKERGYPEEGKLHAIVMRALEKDPEQRFQSAAEMRAALEAYVRESSLFASPLKFGNWLTEHFAEEILKRRRAREQAARPVNAPPEPVMSQTPPPVTTELAPARVVGAGATDALVLDDDPLPFQRRPPRALFAAAALLVMVVVIVLLSR